MSKKRYAPSTVIAAQRRTLDMVASFLETLPTHYMNVLTVDRETGLVTGREVLDHVLAAKKLKATR